MVQDIGMGHKQIMAREAARELAFCHAEKPKSATMDFMEQEHGVGYSWVPYRCCLWRFSYELTGVNQMNVMSSVTIGASLLRHAHSSMTVGAALLRNAYSPQADAQTARIQPRRDSDVRESYNAAVSKAYEAFAKEAAVFHDDQQCFGDELARKAFNTRDEIKKAHQAETSWLGQAGIWIRNLLMYGSDNATYDGLSKKKNPEEIAYSAFKTNGRDLGLTGNGFGDILDTWNAIKADSDLYPEHITPAMVAAFKAQPRGQADVAAILAARTAVVTSSEMQAGNAVDVLSSDEVDITTTMAARPASPGVLSKDDLIVSMTTHTPRRNFAAYI